MEYFSFSCTKETKYSKLNTLIIWKGRKQSLAQNWELWDLGHITFDKLYSCWQNKRLNCCFWDGKIETRAYNWSITCFPTFIFTNDNELKVFHHFFSKTENSRPFSLGNTYIIKGWGQGKLVVSEQNRLWQD